MRIEPVYLVSPPARAPQPPTRRAFLLAGAAFAGGTLVGGACGYTVGARLAAPVEAAVEPIEKPDIRLQTLRRLAVDAPIEQLVKDWNQWWGEFWHNYDRDEVLWRGVDRLADWAVAQEAPPEPQLLSALVMAAQSEWRSGPTTLKSHHKALVALRKRNR